METQKKEYKRLTIEEATEFFSELYGGEHHIPGYKPKQYGAGFSIIHDRGDLATFDYSQLTKLVLMAHDKCIRVSIEGYTSRKVRIAIWARQGREGDISLRHPTIEQAIENYNNSKHK